MCRVCPLHCPTLLDPQHPSACGLGAAILGLASKSSLNLISFRPSLAWQRMWRKMSHPVLCPVFLFQDEISRQSTPQSYHIHVFSSASPPGSLHNCVWQKRAPGIHEEALRSHERAPSGRNINTAAAFFNFCVKTLVTGSASRRCAALAAPHYGHQGARVPFHRPLGLADQGTKMGV